MADTEAAKGRRPPFLAWPGWAHLRYAGWLSLANALWFVAVYGGADSLTARRSFRVPVHVAAELRIPFVPAMTLVYMSIYVLFILAPFVLRTRRELRAAITTLAVITFAGGIGFLLFPAELAFPPPPESELGIWAGLFHFADDLNLTYNLLPSLHVALSVACVAMFSAHAAAAGRVLLWSWAGLIAASTVLIHQHHVLDVVTGWLLAAACVRAAYVPYRGPASFILAATACGAPEVDSNGAADVAVEAYSKHLSDRPPQPLYPLPTPPGGKGTPPPLARSEPGGPALRSSMTGRQPCASC
ncbi:MAG TPA: phosphatase PAP2 family protein [Thermoanaerobaculia bacterium]|nr:phosphatase PAP2 family protein [Thermoanaerobaculia bacterium]